VAREGVRKLTYRDRHGDDLAHFQPAEYMRIHDLPLSIVSVKTCWTGVSPPSMLSGIVVLDCGYYSGRELVSAIEEVANTGG
jgi:hypothetical protein